jgi:predicted membrane protein
METQENKFTETNPNNPIQMMEDYHKHSRMGRFMGGVIILAVGVLLLLRQTGTVIFPPWLFTWPMLLIVIGFYIGARRNFRLSGWPIIMLVGGVFLTQEFYPDWNIRQYIWPIVIIAIGFLMILPRRRRRWGHWGHWGNKEYREQWKQWGDKSQWKQGVNEYGNAEHSSEDYIDSVSIFGGMHKIITSKDFKGGDIVNIFGGGEINLMQADIKGKVMLDVVQIFGGTKIIIPSDWEVQSKMVSIFGSVEDKRNPGLPRNPEKVLDIDGTSIFAGVDIISY